MTMSVARCSSQAIMPLLGRKGAVALCSHFAETIRGVQVAGVQGTNGSEADGSFAPQAARYSAGPDLRAPTYDLLCPS